jgi:hypothetical protein
LAVFVERDHIGDSLFLTLIAAHDELKFDTPTGPAPGSSGKGMSQAMVPELIHNPQHLPTLLLLGHIPIAVGRMAQDTDTPLLRGVPLATSAPFEQFGPLVFRHDALHVQQ